MVVTNYLWSKDSYLEEYDGTGEAILSYTCEPSEFGNIISQYKDNQTDYFQYDAQESTRQLTDSSENINDTFLYDAWGNEVERTGNSDVFFVMSASWDIILTTKSIRTMSDYGTTPQLHPDGKARTLWDMLMD